MRKISAWEALWLPALVAMTAALWAGSAGAQRISDVRGTKHNLSAAPDASTYTYKDGSGTTRTGTVPGRTVKASNESQVCVFCHTPHGGSVDADGSRGKAKPPLWNRKLSSATYTLYTSSSLDANVIQAGLDQPGGTSKLCLSCHDGTLSIGQVNVLNGAGSGTAPGGVSIAMQGGTTTMPSPSAGAKSGFTRNLGINLTNDHPISVTYDSTLVDRDGELRSLTTEHKYPSDGSIIGIRASGYRPKLPLEATDLESATKGQVQCGTCHDPHIREADTSTKKDKGKEKFLRLNRFQEVTPAGGEFSAGNDIICLACHDKDLGNGSWAYSAHANENVTGKTTTNSSIVKYTDTAADAREFPRGLEVWRAACMNCHDTHTVQGSRRLLREGTNTSLVGGLQSGSDGTGPGDFSNSSIENTCYQCHSNTAATIVTPLTMVPNIQSEFSLSYRMPITNGDQTAGVEKHDIGGSFNDGGNADCSGATNKCGKDFVESRERLGRGVGSTNTNRHAECTDCHNPHRVLKKRSGVPGSLATQAATPDAGGAHRHDETTGYTHNNLISGVLRGSWGVEPTYGSLSFHALPSGYTVKRGDPGNDTCTDPATCTPNSKTYVTREYQICLKCHSDYGYADNNVYPTGNRPALGSFTGGTPSGTNGLSMYTNQAKEFQAPLSHADEPLSLGTSAGTADTNYNTNNHRSWHPVMAPTGRTLSKRNMSSGGFDSPWNNAVGTQTMYCSDCHGSNTGSNTVIPTTTNGVRGPWGPHGSTNPFILKGTWDNETQGGTASALCLKCHNPTSSSGFYNSDRDNLHSYHVEKIGRIECTWCHVAVPHGWKNKSLLVNLNDVGEEAGQGVGSSKEVSISGGSDYYTKEPYYLEAKNKIRTFGVSGNWPETNCGSAGKSGTGLTTGRINSTNGNTGNTTGSGKDWMTNMCSSPP